MHTPSWARHALLAALLAAVPAAAQPPPDTAQAFPYRIHTATLKNGLHLVMVPRPGSGLVAYDTLVRVGSRNEVEPGRSGYAHFFEHMMFRGTPRYPAERYQATLQQYGANNNAFTSADITVYTLFGRAEGLEKYVELESDRFQHLAYSKEGFQTEAKAILGEYNKSRASPEAKLYEELCRTAFTRHTYQHTTMGFEADILAMPQGYEYSRGFFGKYYTPDNATVIIVGDFDPARAQALVESAYAGWKGRAALPKTLKEPAQTQERRAEVTWPRPAKPTFMAAWHTPESAPATLRDTVVASVLPELLFGTTSALHKDLVLDRQIADGLDAWSEERRDPALLVVAASARQAADLPEVEASVQRMLENVAKDGVDPARLEAVKSHERYALLSSLEKDSAVAEILAHAMGPTGDPTWLDQQYAMLTTITPADVQAFVARYLVPANRSVVTLRAPLEDGGTP